MSNNELSTDELNDHIHDEYITWWRSTRELHGRTEDWWLQIFPEAKAAYRRRLREQLKYKKELLEEIIEQIPTPRYPVLGNEAWFRNEAITKLKEGIRCLKWYLKTKDSDKDKPTVNVDIARKHPIQDIHGNMKKRGKNWVGLCEFHEESTPSLNVNEDKNVWYCFGCSEGGDAIKYAMKKFGIPFLSAVKKLT